MADISKALGEPIPFVFREQTYQLSPLTYALQSKFEYWLKERAFRELERQKDNLSPADYERFYMNLLARVVAGEYSFGGKVSADAVNSVDGVKEVFFISLTARHPNVTRQFVDEIFAEKMKEANASVNAVNADTADPTNPLASPTGQV